MHGDKASLRAWAIAKVDEVSEQASNHYMECQDLNCPAFTFLLGLYEAYRAILWQSGIDVDEYGTGEHLGDNDGSATTS